MAKYTESIIQKDENCFICKREHVPGTKDMEIHHVMYGPANRKLSEKYGLKVNLCPECHRGTYGVHGKYGAELSTKLKIIAQHHFEKEHSHEEWMKIFGRNYL